MRQKWNRSQMLHPNLTKKIKNNCIRASNILYLCFFITLYYKQTNKQTTNQPTTIWQAAFVVWFLQTKKVWTIKIIMFRVRAWAGETFRCVGIWSDSQLLHKVPTACTIPPERCRAVRSCCKITVISGSSHYTFLYYITFHLICWRNVKVERWTLKRNWRNELKMF